MVLDDNYIQGIDRKDSDSTTKARDSSVLVTQD
jgi:hypothetical protein